MTIVRGLNRCRLFPRIRVVFVCASLFGVILASSLQASEDSVLKPLVKQLFVAGEKYDPQPLVDQGLAGLRAVMDHVFPETAEQKNVEKVDLSAQIAALIEQMGDESFERREEATDTLRRLGTSCDDMLRQALEHKDLEIRSRARKLIAEVETPRETHDKYQGLRAYVEKLKEVECQQELARRVTKALEARLDLTSKQDALKVCLLAMTRWPTNRVHGELLPLVKLEDPAPAIFAMRQIGGRTGNNYVSAIHMGAIASGRPELIKCGHRSMPCPIWDEENMPKIKAALEKFFDGSEVPAELRGDDEFMYLNAFVAARDFRIPQARAWLIARIKQGNEKESLRAIHSLGDTYYMRNPLDAELLAALEPHLTSEDAKFRAAAIYTLGVYRGEAIQPALLKAFADPDKKVWQTAGDRLKNQHSYYQPGKSPIPKLLESELATTKDAAHKSRLDFFLKYLQQEKPPYLRWPE